MDLPWLGAAWNWPRPLGNLPAALRLAWLPVLIGTVVSTAAVLGPLVLLSRTLRHALMGGYGARLDLADPIGLTFVAIAVDALVWLWLAAGMAAAWGRHLVLGRPVGSLSFLRFDRTTAHVYAVLFWLGLLFLVLRLALGKLIGGSADIDEVPGLAELLVLAEILLLVVMLPLALAVPLAVRGEARALGRAWRLSRSRWPAVAGILVLGLAPVAVLLLVFGWAGEQLVAVALATEDGGFGPAEVLAEGILSTVEESFVAAVARAALLLCAVGVGARLVQRLEGVTTGEGP